MALTRTPDGTCWSINSARIACIRGSLRVDGYWIFMREIISNADSLRDLQGKKDYENNTDKFDDTESFHQIIISCQIGVSQYFV